MRNTLLISTSILVALSTLTRLVADEPLPTISVTGSAVVRVVPDEVLLTASVESRAKSLADAVTDNDTRIAKVIEYLKESGISDTQIRTETIQIQPIMPPERYPKQQIQSNVAPRPTPTGGDGELPEPLGFTVRRQFAITIVQLNRFEEIYRGLIQRGINNVSGANFRTSELRKHRDQARLLAVQAAREKAGAMAGELGATLSGVKSIDETPDHGYFGSNTFQNVRSESGGEATFVAGQIEITARVNIVFYLGDTRFGEQP